MVGTILVGVCPINSNDQCKESHIRHGGNMILPVLLGGHAVRMKVCSMKVIFVLVAIL